MGVDDICRIDDVDESSSSISTGDSGEGDSGNATDNFLSDISLSLWAWMSCIESSETMKVLVVMGWTSGDVLGRKGDLTGSKGGGLARLVEYTLHSVSASIAPFSAIQCVNPTNSSSTSRTR